MRDLLSVETQEMDVARDEDSMVAACEIEMLLVRRPDGVGVGSGGDIVAAAAEPLRWPEDVLVKVKAYRHQRPWRISGRPLGDSDSMAEAKSWSVFSCCRISSRWSK